MGAWENRNAALFTGAAIAILAVWGQAFMGILPPSAYGICIACHGRDLVNGALNWILGLKLAVAEVSSGIPALTVLGILIGAFLAARENKEFRIWTPVSPVISAILGLLVMISALLIMACPIRLVLRSAYGDPTGWFGLAGLIIGVTGATLFLKRRAVR